MPRTLLAAALCALLAVPAHAGPIDIGDDINARLARAKSQQAADATARSRALLRQGDVTLIGAGTGGAGGAAAGALGSGCNIAIGNVFEDTRIGTSARRETTVIVTGDIIQVGNNCR